jgi:aminoglycoside phosphotransferase family enzyme
MVVMNLPGIEEKVAFLRRPDAYPDSVRRVEVKETHMSWVFLTESHAWKLKKPVRTDDVDFSSLDARRRNCVREVRLNRRLARSVYQAVTPLSVDHCCNLRLSGQGEIVDWLVRMRRLPAEQMLDALIARHAVTETDLSRLASVLIDFYRQTKPIPITALTYRHRLANGLRAAWSELTGTDYGLVQDMADPIIESQLKALDENANLFDGRVSKQKIIEAHGDLRPEHICLEAQPVIIDCLEFNTNLRCLDVASELAFLALECERLGAPHIGQFILDRYSERTCDVPPAALMAFYRAYHACIRAKLAVRHLSGDRSVNRAKWIARAEQYLSMVARERSRTGAV